MSDNKKIMTYCQHSIFRYVKFEKNFYDTVRLMKPEFENMTGVDNLVYRGGLAFDHESTVIFQRELK